MTNQIKYEEFQELAMLSKKDIGESEESVKINFIVIFLELLGHKRMNYEHDRTDIFISKGLPNDCSIIVECKKYEKDLDYDVDQLKRYWDKKRSLLALLINGKEILIFSPFWKGKSFSDTLIYRVNREQLSDKGIVDKLYEILSYESLKNKTAKKFIDDRENFIDEKKEAIENVITELHKQRQQLEENNKILLDEISKIKSSIREKEAERLKEIPTISLDKEQIESEESSNEIEGFPDFTDFFDKVSERVRSKLDENLSQYKNTWYNKSKTKQEWWMRYHWGKLKDTSAHIAVSICKEDGGELSLDIYLWSNEKEVLSRIEKNKKFIGDNLKIGEEDLLLNGKKCEAIMKHIAYIDHSDPEKFIDETVEVVVNFIKTLKRILDDLI